jgi:alkylation response protein AidB-like acyl-CoA dehydrogenase
LAQNVVSAVSPLMHLQPSSRQRELIARARRLARERFAPRADRHDRDASFRGRLSDNQPQPPRYTASRQRFLRAASEARYHRVSRAASNHTQTLITFAYHWVRRILLRHRAFRADRAV